MSSSIFFSNTVYLQLFFQSFLLALLFALICAAIGLSLMTLSARTLAVLRRRGIFDKCALQLGQLALIFAWAVTGIACFSTGKFFYQDFHMLTRSPMRYGVVLICILLLLQAILSSIACIKDLRVRFSYRFIDACLALSSIIGACAVYTSISIIHAALLPGTPLPGSATVGETLRFLLFPAGGDIFWPIAAAALFMEVTAAGGFACIWLVARREKDDFGRDYYTQMLPWCARWAVTACIALAPFSAYLTWRGLTMVAFQHTPLFFAWISAASLFPLAAAALWFWVQKSPNPMRHKISVLLAPILMLMGVALTLSALALSVLMF